MMESGEKYTEGSFEILRGDKSCINFLSPDEYSSITVQGDSSGNADIFTFELYGIPANVPKSISGSISLLFSLFSDAIPSHIQTLDDSCFTLYDSEGTCLVSFSENNINFDIIYSTTDGSPLAINAEDENVSVSINITELQTSKKNEGQ